MSRTTVNRSVSFDPQIFHKMEDRRAKLLMQRSEYLTRLVVRDLLGDTKMSLSEIPEEFLEGLLSARDRTTVPEFFPMTKGGKALTRRGEVTSREKATAHAKKKAK